MTVLSGLLDERRITGVRPVRRELAPRNKAIMVDRDDMLDFRAAIENACQCWGGGSNILIPASYPSSISIEIGEPWSSFLRKANPDWIDPRGKYAPGPIASGTHQCDSNIGISLLSLVANQQRSTTDWTPVSVASVDINDPWAVAYLAVLGSYPEEPSPELLRPSGLREDLRFQDILNVERIGTVQCDYTDLLQRLRAVHVNNPAAFSTFLLSRFPGRADASWIDRSSPLPSMSDTADRFGANLIVVYEPGSVEDGCLLWNLRAAHGLPNGFPLGLPTTADVQLAFRFWTGMGAHAWGTLMGRPAGVVSRSVPADRLDRIARTIGAEVVAPDDVLRPWKRPARVSSDVVSLANGQSPVAAWTSDDRDRVGHLKNLTRGGGLVSHLELVPDELPDLPWLHDYGFPFPNGFRRGGFEASADDPDMLAEFDWPSGWLVLEWALKQRGLQGTPSRQGHAATALLGDADSLMLLRPLLSLGVVEQLERVSQARALTWLKQRTRRIAADVTKEAGKPEQQINRIEQALREMRMSADQQDRPPMTASSLQSAIRPTAARDAWLLWAERSQLLLRGVGVKCDRCRYSFWTPISSMAPPINCPGCGRSIQKPFPAPGLTFQYRATEQLAQVVELDALPHLLAMRWWFDLLGVSWGRGSFLYGAYPGVELRPVDGGDVIAEVDVLMLFKDGSLVPGECKRYSGGLNQEELAKLDRAVEALAAPWSFVATLDRASACDDRWRRHTDASRPRYPLTAEHLLDSHVVWGLGMNPLEWKEMTDDEWREREAKFVENLAELVGFIETPKEWGRLLIERGPGS